MTLGLQHLSALNNLTYINFTGCLLISDDGLQHLKPLENLAYLDLGGCEQITDQGFEHLTALINLMNINVPVQVSTQILRVYHLPESNQFFFFFRFFNYSRRHVSSLPRLQTKASSTSKPSSTSPPSTSAGASKSPKLPCKTSPCPL